MTSNLKKKLEGQLVHSQLENNFIQLMHPGGEPIISRAHPSYCPPNTSKVHTRKFLSSSGEYLNEHCQVQHAQLNFWGEWELGSHVWRIKQNPVQFGMPLYVHSPDCPQNTSDSAIINELTDERVLVDCKSESCSNVTIPCGYQSTDPFVFCNPFLYFHCQIKPNRQLDKLQSGDVVIFGSHLKGQFVLDTVFVVSERIKLDDPKICQKFLLVNKPFLNQFSDRVYLGATFANPVNGMFSFFPALPVKDKWLQPFDRPKIKLSSYINNNLMMHHKICHSDKIDSLWLNLVDQVINSGLWLGLKA